MDSAFIHQAANELVQTAGTRNIKQIARSCSLDISETSRIKDMYCLSFFIFQTFHIFFCIFHKTHCNHHDYRTNRECRNNTH